MPVCSICLETMNVCSDVCIKTTCRHAFHGPCLSTWFHVRQECPVCRRGLTRYDCTVLHFCQHPIDTVQLNDIQFRLSSPHDLRLCILFLFLQQSHILLTRRHQTPRMDSLLEECMFDIVCAVQSPPRPRGHPSIPRSRLKEDVRVPTSSSSSKDRYPTTTTPTSWVIPGFFGNRSLRVDVTEHPCPVNISVDDFRSMVNDTYAYACLPYDALL